MRGWGGTFGLVLTAAAWSAATAAALAADAPLAPANPAPIAPPAVFPRYAFLLLAKPAKFEKGKSYKVVFEAARFGSTRT
jgi:hypothetical protein